MTTAIATDLTALVRAALADLGAGPGVLSDWLEDRGDPRGVLLRRRWKRWQATVDQIWLQWQIHVTGPDCVAIRVASAWERSASGDFAAYIRHKFPSEATAIRQEQFGEAIRLLAAHADPESAP